MGSDVVVSFDRAKQYQFRVLDRDLAGVTADDASRWLDEQWNVLECEVVRPTGKILLFDKVLGVARNAGETRFAEQSPWAQSFARNVARLLERPVVVVDVEEDRVG